MYTKDDVARIAEDIAGRDIEPPIEVGESYDFGLSLDVFDPVSGHIITVARPHRPDIGQTQILRSGEEVARDVAAGRITKLHAERAAGVTYLNPQYNAAAKAAAAAHAAEEAKKAQEAADAAKVRADRAGEEAKAAQSEAAKVDTSASDETKKNEAAQAAAAKTKKEKDEAEAVAARKTQTAVENPAGAAA